MARCDEGYLCEVCGEEVEDITESDLYLRFVLGEVDPETLHVSPERHIRCNPTFAQFIVDDDVRAGRGRRPVFEIRAGPGVRPPSEEARVTAGYRRLQEIFRTTREMPDHRVPPTGRDGTLEGRNGRSAGDLRQVQPALTVSREHHGGVLQATPPGLRPNSGCQAIASAAIVIDNGRGDMRPDGSPGEIWP